MNIEEIKEEILKIEVLKNEAYNKHHLIEKQLQEDRKPIDEKIDEFVKEFKSRLENQWIHNYVKEKMYDTFKQFGFCSEEDLENIKGDAIIQYPFYDFDYYKDGISFSVRRPSDDDDYHNYSWKEIAETMK
jgi:hypothetical protein